MTKRSKLLATLLVLTILSTCVISGTFAQYTTSGTATDSARVAKFGVTVAASTSEAFAKTYDGTVSADVKVVAPGTKGSTSFTISGTPEVKVKITATSSNTNEIKLAANNTTGYTLAAGKFATNSCTLKTDADYAPIKWYFGTTPGTTPYTMTMDQLKAALADVSAEKAANTTLNETYYIGWEWPITTEFTSGTWSYNGGSAAPYATATMGDFLDTYLGENNTQTEGFTISITVEQVD